MGDPANEKFALVVSDPDTNCFAVAPPNLDEIASRPDVLAHVESGEKSSLQQFNSRFLLNLDASTKTRVYQKSLELIHVRQCQNFTKIVGVARTICEKNPGTVIHLRVRMPDKLIRDVVFGDSDHVCAAPPPDQCGFFNDSRFMSIMVIPHFAKELLSFEKVTSAVSTSHRLGFGMLLTINTQVCNHFLPLVTGLMEDETKLEWSRFLSFSKKHSGFASETRKTVNVSDRGKEFQSAIAEECEGPNFLAMGCLRHLSSKASNSSVRSGYGCNDDVALAEFLNIVPLPDSVFARKLLNAMKVNCQQRKQTATTAMSTTSAPSTSSTTSWKKSKTSADTPSLRITKKSIHDLIFAIGQAKMFDELVELMEALAKYDTGVFKYLLYTDPKFYSQCLALEMGFATFNKVTNNFSECLNHSKMAKGERTTDPASLLILLLDRQAKELHKLRQELLKLDGHVLFETEMARIKKEMARVNEYKASARGDGDFLVVHTRENAKRHIANVEKMSCSCLWPNQMLSVCVHIIVAAQRRAQDAAKEQHKGKPGRHPTVTVNPKDLFEHVDSTYKVQELKRVLSNVANISLDVDLANVSEVYSILPPQVAEKTTRAKRDSRTSQLNLAPLNNNPFGGNQQDIDSVEEDEEDAIGDEDQEDSE